MSGEFVLSRQLLGHEADIRTVLALDSGVIISGSRDRSIRLWAPVDGNNYEAQKILLGHEHYVACLSLIKDKTFFPGAFLASGGFDKTIRIWSEEDATPILTLTGHENVVCCLSEAAGRVVSGSWDHTARVWEGTNCTAVLKHTHPVLAILGFPSGEILTGCGDNIIRLWKNGQEVMSFKGHTNCVRALALFPPLGFLSCGNDGEVRLWALSGECLHMYPAHEEFSYAVTAIGSDAFASSSEDLTVKVWSSGGDLKQTITHPSSVWSLASLPNGDLVTACSDGIVRVWTTSQERAADETQVAAYKDVIEAAVTAKTKGGNLDTSKLPGKEALLVPGTKNGENKIINNDGVPECYSWSSASQQWHKIGDVLGANNEPSNTLNGKHYDHIFEINLDEGFSLKLGYNNGQDPWMVAQQFIWDNDLPQDHLETIANFIQKNSRAFVIGQTPSVGYVDPYTGASRYVPQAPAVATPLSDPYTGGSRYTPGPATTPIAPTPAVAPPTLPPSSLPSILPQTSPAQSSFGSFTAFPQLSPVLFNQINFQALLGKLQEFNKTLTSTNSEFALNDTELQLIQLVTRTLTETSKYHASTFTQGELAVFQKLLSWPENMRFPCLDLLRSFVLHPNVAKNWANNAALVPYLLQQGLSAKVNSPTNIMLGARVFANMFSASDFENLLWNNQEQILEAAAECISISDTKNHKLSLITLVLNYCSLLYRKPKEEGKMQCLSLLSELLKTEKDEENLFRGLVGLGTITWQDEATKSLVEDFDFKRIILEQSKSSSPKASKVATELKQYLQF